MTIDCTPAVTDLDDTARRAVCRDPERGFTVIDLILWAIVTQPAFTGSMRGLLSAARIDAAARAAGDTLVLEPEDQARLAEALQEPAGGYPLHPPLALLPLLRAICEETPR